MKAIRLTDQVGPNPAYSKAKAAEAKAKGLAYKVPKEITFEAGSECDHPLCWIHCCRAEPTMRPADKECEDKVYAYLNHPSRLAQLARLKELSQPEVLKHLPAGMQSYVTQMAAKWLGNSTDSSDASSESDAVDVGPFDHSTLAFFDTTEDGELIPAV